MADFLQDYSNLAAAGSAFEGFAKGYSDAQDKKMKRMEMEAQIEAMKTKGQREAAESAIQSYKSHLSYDPATGAVTPRETYDPMEQAEAQRHDLPLGYNTTFSPEGKYLGSKVDPASLKAQANAIALEKVRGMVEATKGRTDLARSRFDENQNKNAASAGTAFEHDKLLQQMKTTQNNLGRAQGMLDGKVPLTAKNFNLLQQDLISATAPGGVASEGKMNREMVETWAGKLNDLSTKLGNVDDIRKAQPKIVNQLRDLMGEIGNEYKSQMEQQASDIHDSFKFNTNPKVKETIKDKLRRYAPEKYNEVYGGGQQSSQGLVAPQPGLVGSAGLVPGSSPQAPPPAQDPQIAKYAQDNKLDYAHAEAILRKRGYGGQQ